MKKLKQQLIKAFGRKSVKDSFNELTLTIDSSSVVEVCTQLRDEFNFDILIDYSNDGNKEGSLEIQIVTWIGEDASSPVSYTCPDSLMPGDDDRWRIPMDQFPESASNVRYVILDMNNEEITSIKNFTVAKYSADDSSSDGLLSGGGGLVLGISIKEVIPPATAALASV